MTGYNIPEPLLLSLVSWVAANDKSTEELNTDVRCRPRQPIREEEIVSADCLCTPRLRSNLVETFWFWQSLARLQVPEPLIVKGFSFNQWVLMGMIIYYCCRYYSFWKKEKTARMKVIKLCSFVLFWNDLNFYNFEQKLSIPTLKKCYLDE